MYNPFSVLSALKYGSFESYWFATGTPTFLAQIDDRGYLTPYTVDGRQLIKVGANFSKKTKNIDKWVLG